MRQPRAQYEVFISDNPSEREMERFYHRDLAHLTPQDVYAESFKVTERLTDLVARRVSGRSFVAPDTMQPVYEYDWLGHRLQVLQRRRQRIA